MKKYLLFVSCGIIFTFISCGETVVIENKPDQSVSSPPISGYFKKRALIEDYTGTWCGNCTRVSYAIELAKEQSDKIVSVAIHNGNDPYHFAEIQPLKNLILPNSPLALPVSRLNRLDVWAFPEYTNVQQALDLTSNNTTLGLAMSSTLTNNTIALDVNMRFLDDYSNLKLVVYLLEDHLFYSQKNYTDFYNGVNPILNYEHNHVLRKSITNILGDAITESTEKNSERKKQFSFTVPANISNTNNINFVAFIVGSDNKVINVRSSHINENQQFELNP
jgi:hypothetical protein